MASTTGKLLDSVTIRAHAHGTGFLEPGQTLRIIDLEGQQVADFVSIRKGDPTEYLDCVYTNWELGRWQWAEGDTICTNHMQPMWTITGDQTGVHYTGGGFCSRAARRRYLSNDEKGCRDVLEDAFADHGIPAHYLQSVSCFNVFMNVDYAPDGRWQIREPVTKAGDYIDLRAEMDLMWAVSVCAWPEVVNGTKPTSLRFETYAAA